MTEHPGPLTETGAPVKRSLDTKTVEVLALGAFRMMFRDGIHIPFKLKGTMDLDLVVRDNNVLVNLNEVNTEVPELSIWRVVFAYKGKPVVEYGRGVKNDMKIHYLQLCALLLAVWQERRRKLEARVRGAAVRDRAMVSMAVTRTLPAGTEETTS